MEQPRIPPTEYVVTELEPRPRRSPSWPRARASAPPLGTCSSELGTGGTRVTLAVEQAGPVGAVMGRFFRRLTDRYLTAEAEGLKARSEGRV